MRLSGILIFMARRDLSYLKNSLLFIVGLPCGVFTGVTGIGTSVVTLPLLAYLLALRGPKATGTAMAVTFFAALTAMLSYGQHYEVFWGLGVILAIGQVGGAVIGQGMIARAPSIIKPTLIWPLVMILIGLGMSATAFGWPRQGVPGQDWALLTYAPPHGALFFVAAIIIAIVLGVISRLMPYGPVLLVPAGIFLLGLSPEAAQGTALFVVLLASLPGMLMKAQRSEIHPQAATWVSIGVVFGALAGAFYATSILPSLLLVLIFGAVLIIVGLGMVSKRPTSESPA